VFETLEKSRRDVITIEKSFEFWTKTPVTQDIMPFLRDFNRCRCFFYNNISPARPAGGLSGLIKTYFSGFEQ
jgi:hypothetical protein